MRLLTFSHAPIAAQVIECEDDRKLRNFYDKRINQVIAASEIARMFCFCFEIGLTHHGRLLRVIASVMSLRVMCSKSLEETTSRAFAWFRCIARKFNLRPRTVVCFVAKF